MGLSGTKPYFFKSLHMSFSAARLFLFIADLGHHRWLQLKSRNGKPNGDVTMTIVTLANGARNKSPDPRRVWCPR